MVNQSTPYLWRVIFTFPFAELKDCHECQG